jgi:hypothetical protein
MGRAPTNVVQAAQRLQELLGQNAQVTVQLPPHAVGDRSSWFTSPTGAHTSVTFSSSSPPELSGSPAASGPAQAPGGAIADLDGYDDLKPDPLTARTAADFVERMKDYRIWAGEPSYRELARRSGKAFGASSLCEALNSTRLPAEKLVRAFIWACSHSEHDIQVWVTAWRHLRLRHKRVQGEVLAPVTELSSHDQRRKTG